jgi:hypothetical protein
LLPLLAILFGAGFTLLAAYALGVLLLRRLPAPPEIALGVGAAAASTLVFLALLVNGAYWFVFLAAGLLLVGQAIVFRGLPWSRNTENPGARQTTKNDRLPHGPLLFLAILAPYAAWYFVNALAPEVVADGVTYHLGLPSEYIALGGFPDRIDFFGVAPQGMEMLYTAAFAFGRHSAAKLVEFAFFIATLPLIFRVGRRLGIGNAGTLLAAVLYFCAPVAGITGSSSYTDAAGVFFALAAFYVLLLWKDSADERYLLPAGVLAGFCYAIKFPGGFAAAGAVLFALAHRRFRAAALVAAGAALIMTPWVARAFALTGNPFAPLLNGLFPNPYFHLATERELAAGLRSLGPVTPAGVPWELAFGDRLTGTFGPLLFALPLALLALRRPAGRACLAAAVLLAIPWWFNSGARFLMPAVAFAALALGMVLPRPAAWAAIVLQAALCWPQVIDTWETRVAFRLHEFPLAAALRLTPEAEYIRNREEQYNVAKLAERLTPPDARILALMPVANAYLDRDVRVTWHSAEGDLMLDALRMGALDSGTPLFDWKAVFPLQPMHALRFRMPAGYGGEWDIVDVELYSGGDRVFNSPQWTLRGWPNPWELPLAFDNNLAARWRTWEPVRAGMYVEISLDRPQRLSSAVVLSHAPLYRPSFEVFGKSAPAGAWRRLSNAPEATPRPERDLRREATHALRRAGYQWILAPTGAGGNAPIGNDLASEAPKWGIQIAGDAGRFLLFHIK